MAYTFNVYDYLVLSLVLLVSIAIGLYHGIKLQYPNLFSNLIKKLLKRANTEEEIESNTNDRSQMKEYMIANASMSAFPVALSLLASFFSSTALLGMPAEVYEYGIEYVLIVIGVMITPIIGAFLTGPLFARLKVLSVFEYIKLRYRSNILHKIAVICYIIRSLVGTAIYIYGPSTTLDALTDIDTITSIIIIGAVGTFYTTIGGIKAVIWTDVFQMTIMIVGMTVIIAKGTYDVGGISELWQINANGGRINFFNFNPYPFVRQTFWAMLFGMLVQFGLPYCVDQVMVQRFASAKNIRTAQIALLLNSPGSLIVIGICSFTGLVLYATYYKCDPITATTIQEVTNPNQLLTYFVTDKLNALKGMTGLFLACILSGSLSSVSSTLNSLSAIIWEDILKHFKYFNSFNDKKTTITAKILVVICGVICTSLSLIVSRLGGNLVQINTTLIGSFNAPILGLFVLSCVFPFANVYGGIAGSVLGFGISLWLSFGSFIMKPKYPKLVVGTDCYDNNATTLLPINTTYSPILSNNYAYRVDNEVINLSGFNKVYSISYMLLPFLGTLSTIIIGVAVSLCTCGHRETVDDSLILFKFLNRCNKREKIEPKSDNIQMEDTFSVNSNK